MSDTHPSVATCRRRIPWGLVGMLGLVWCVEGAVARRADEWKPPLAVSWEAARRSSETDALGAEVLCLGDSQVHHGVSPKVLAGRLGGRAYGLAVTGGQAASTYGLLRSATDAGARPRALLVNFNADQLASPPRQVTELMPEVLDGREQVRLLWAARDPLFALEWLGARALPTLGVRNGLRVSIVAAIRGEVSFTSLQRRAMFELIHDGQGWMPMPANPKDFSAAERSLYGPDRRGRPWKPHRANVEYLDRFLALAASRSLPVYWVLPPVTPMAQAWQERVGREDAFLRFVRARQAAYPNVALLDARRVGLDRTFFHDPTHLNAEGSALFSAALADALAADLQGPSAEPARKSDTPRVVEVTLRRAPKTPVAAEARPSVAR